MSLATTILFVCSRAHVLPGSISGVTKITKVTGFIGRPGAQFRQLFAMARNCSGFGVDMYMPKPGAFVCFVDPCKTALSADVFWKASVYGQVVSAYVRNVREPGFGGAVCLGDVRCARTLLKTFDGEQHILFRLPNRAAQVRCIGENIRTDPFMLELIVDRFPDVESSHRLVRQLANIYRNRCLDGTGQEWTVEAQRHRDALVAYDLKQIGYTYRDIACFLIDMDFVVEEWANPNRTLKNRMIRNVKRGVHMVGGGYLSLLK